jgi:hypothetical protein
MDSTIHEVSKLIVELDEFDEAPCCGVVIAD